VASQLPLWPVPQARPSTSQIYKSARVPACFVLASLGASISPSSSCEVAGWLRICIFPTHPPFKPSLRSGFGAPHFVRRARALAGAQEKEERKDKNLEISGKKQRPLVGAGRTDKHTG